MRFLLLTLISLLLLPEARAQVFQAIPGSRSADAVSADGRVVAGQRAGLITGYRWSTSGTVDVIPDIAGRSSFIRGMAGDGSIVVGYIGLGIVGIQAFQWTPSGGSQNITSSLGGVKGTAYDASGDGNVVVGELWFPSNKQAFRRTPSSIDFLGDFSGLPLAFSTARAVSDDGDTVVGAARNADNRNEAFRWAADGRGMVSLGLGLGFSMALEVSPEGEVVFGKTGPDASNQSLFRWSESTGLEVLGPLSLVSDYIAASDSGRVVVGGARSGANPHAFIWTENTGFRDLKTVLIQDYGLDLSGWTLEFAQDISNDGTVIVGTGTNPSGEMQGWRVDLSLSPPGVAVRDVNRFGRHTGHLANTTVTFYEGESIAASMTTDDVGIADTTDLGIDLTQPYDIRIERGDVVRTYRQLVPEDLADTTLVLPVTLVETLNRRLTGLDTTNTFVLGYDTDPAHQLVADWTSPLTADGTNALAPEDASVLRDRDRALARLLDTSEGLEDLYLSVKPLSDETASVTVDAFMGLVAFRKVLRDTQPSTPTSTLPPTLVESTIQLILESIRASLSLFEAQLIEAASAILPEWAAGLLIKTDQVANSTGATVFNTGAWDFAEGRRSLIQQAYTSAAKEVGSVVMASGHVIVADDELAVASARSRQLEGEGTLIQSFQARRDYVTDRTDFIDDTVDLSQALSSTFNGWNSAADVAVAAGAFPPLELAAAIGAALRAFDTGALVSVSVADLFQLYDATFEYAHFSTELAYNPGFPTGVLAPELTPSPARRRAASTRQTTTEAYLARLDALMAAIEAEDYDTAVTEAQALLADADALENAIEAERLRLLALAEKALADDDDGGEVFNRSAGRAGPFADAYARSTTASTGFLGEQMSFYAALAATLVPELALPPEGSSEPPFAARDSLLAIAPRLSAAVTTASSTMETTLGLTDGLAAEALVMLPEHGLPDPAGRAGWTAPDQSIPFQARVVNAGDEAATGIEVRLVIDGDTTGGAPAMRVISDRVQTLNELAPGAEETLTWWVATRDTSSTGTGSVAVYELVTSASSGRVRGAAGGVEVTSAAPVSEEESVEQVTEVSLRVYPNPTRGASSMQVDLPEPARVHVAVYDALGREVAVALDDDRSVGSHVIELATDGLAPGVYVVRLVTGGDVQTTSLTVVR